MRADLSYLGAVALLAAAYASYMLAGVSGRLGEVRGMPPRHRYAYWGAGLLAYAGAVRLIVDVARIEVVVRLLVYDLPLAVGAVMVLVVAVKYWGWLIHEG